MNYSCIIVEKNNHIGFIKLNRPEQMNTFNIQLAEEFNEALLQMEKDSEVRVVVVKGEGRAFCTGIDLTEIKGKTPLDYFKLTQLMNKFTLTMADMSKPVIVGVHKFAVANGVGIVAAADLCIASEDTKFGTTAVNVGLFCMGPAVPLYRCVGRKKSLELLLTGDMIDTTEAERIGLINRSVPYENLDDEVLKLAEKLAAKSPLAVQIGKRSLYKMADLELHKAIEMVNHDFTLLCTTDDAAEGIAAFKEKRDPQWKLS